MPLLTARTILSRAPLLNRAGGGRAALHSLPVVTPFRRQWANRAVVVRHASVLSAIPRAAFKAFRASAIAGGVGAGALAYANHKVDGFKTAANEKLDALKEWGGSAYESTADALGRAKSGIGSTAQEAAEWTNNRLGAFKSWFGGSAVNEEGSEYYEEFEEEPTDKRPLQTPAAALALSTAATIQGDLLENDDPSNDLMLLTRKLIEIRSILLSIDHAEALSLPSIVVIGSQSSGKSSVLEAIVGHEFLPKGNNMVTRRPIELTLIHTPRTSKDPRPREFAEFPNDAPGQHVTDFAVIQQKLTDMNLAVPASEAVSPNPIHLRIHSPNVPDLTLVDLPGYVQIASMDQPEELKDKIASLCDKYIRANNIILAVCAADVDLANSPALRASRKVDPLGLRTIGVVTKMDLVAPEQGASVLSNDRYPLALGYVGVVCKAVAEKEHQAHNENVLVRLVKGSPNNTDLIGPVAKQEAAFFGGNNAILFKRPGIQTGTSTLKRRLMEVLEESMSSSLAGISDAVSNELEEASYQFKVQYNDRAISAESYVAETMDFLKARTHELQALFKKPQARAMLRQEVDNVVLDTLAPMYWADAKLPELTKLATDTKNAPTAESLDIYWKHKLEASTGALTKSGIGRMSTNLLAQQVRDRVAALASQEPFIHHPNASERIMALADAILHDRYALTAEQVENSVKPLKREVEVEPAQWEEGRNYSIKLVEEDLKQCDASLKRIQEAVGTRKLKNALDYVKDVEERERRKRERRLLALTDPNAVKSEEEDVNDPNRPVYNPNLLIKAREAAFLRDRADILRQRMAVLKTKRCKAGPDNAAFCPEAFLSAVATQLTYTAVQHINTELLGEFFYQFPRQIDSRYHLDQEEITRFARENPIVGRHLDLQERKECDPDAESNLVDFILRKLELVSGKLDSLVKLQAEKTGARRPERRGIFGLF